MGDTTTSYAETVEGVRAAIAAYTQALDDGRTDDVLATYVADGIFDMPGVGTFQGHDELRTTYDGWKPQRPQRHLVVNTLLTDWGADTATASSDVVLLVQGKAGWSVGFVARYTDTLRCIDGTWKFERRAVSPVP